MTAAMAKKIFAATAPVKTLSAEMSGPAASANNASWVLSPNSARNVVVNEFLITALAGRCNDESNVLCSSMVVLAGFRVVIPKPSASDLMPNSRNVIPDTVLMRSMETVDLIHTPMQIHNPAPIVKARTLPVNTQRALCLAARRKVVKKDLSPIPATATVANAVVNPAKTTRRCFSQNITEWLPSCCISKQFLD